MFFNPNDEWQVNSETLLVKFCDENTIVLPYAEEVGRTG
jgi:hypothetical protein